MSDYEAYLRSPEWEAKKAEYRANPRLPQACVVCGNRRVDLHHRTYLRVGRERLTDLVPLCRDHHDEAHKIRLAMREARVRKPKSPRAQSQSDAAWLATARQLDWIRRLGGTPPPEMTKREARKMYERLQRSRSGGPRHQP